MASQYAEDIGVIKATLERVVKVQEQQGDCITSLMDDSKFRRRLARYGKALFFAILAALTFRFGDIKGIFGG